MGNSDGFGCCVDLGGLFGRRKLVTTPLSVAAREAHRLEPLLCVEQHRAVLAGASCILR